MYTIYGKANCSYCDRAKTLLAIRELPFVYHDIMTDLEQRTVLLALQPNLATVPQIYLDDKLVGGYTELFASLIVSENPNTSVYP